MRRVEAVVFAAARPVGRDALAAVVGRGCNLDLLLDDIRGELRTRPYEIVSVAGGYQFRTRPGLAAAVRAAGVVDEQGAVLARTRRPTPSASPSDVEDVIAECVQELRAAHEVEAVGIGAAGFIDADRAKVYVAPNLSWRDEPLRDAVAERVGLPVVVENDANAAAWAEHRFGAGRERFDQAA